MTSNIIGMTSITRIDAISKYARTAEMRWISVSYSSRGWRRASCLGFMIGIPWPVNSLWFKKAFLWKLLVREISATPCYWVLNHKACTQIVSLELGTIIKKFCHMFFLRRQKRFAIMRDWSAFLKSADQIYLLVGLIRGVLHQTSDNISLTSAANWKMNIISLNITQ